MWETFQRTALCSYFFTTDVSLIDKDLYDTLDCNALFTVPQVAPVGYSILTLKLRHPGVFFVCGDNAYKALPPQWQGLCTLAVFPNITLYPTLNASSIPNLGSFVHRLRLPCTNNITAEHHSFGWRILRVLFPRVGVYQVESAVCQ